MANYSQDDLFGRNTQPPVQPHADLGAHDPFARPAPSGGEPLFPAAPAGWTGSAFPRDAGLGAAGAAPLSPSESPAAHNTTDWYTPSATPAPGAKPMPSVDFPAATGTKGAWFERGTETPASLYKPPTGTPADAPVTPPAAPEPAAPPAPQAAPPRPANAPKRTALRSPQSTVANRNASLNALETNFNQRFAVIMDLMQHGAWPQALEKMRALKADYPRAYFLEPLIDEAELKAALMEQWALKIKGRRFTVAQEWLIRRSIPFLALLLLFTATLIFYQSFIAPSRQVVAMARINQAHVEAATDLVQQGSYVKAVELYTAVLARDPDNTAAAQGLAEAKRLMGVAVTYDVALQVAAAGNLPRALRMLNSIAAGATAYRDVDAKINQLTTQAATEKAFLQAEKTFGQRRWLAAVTSYEQVQQLSTDYKEVIVKQRLNESYYHAGRTLALRWPTESTGADTARTYLRKAQSAGIQREETGRLLDDLDLYFKGLRALDNGNVGQAINAWQKLIDEQPDLLGGYAAEQLYRAYLTLAGEVRESDAAYARQLYEAAARLPVQDPSEARRQLG